MKIAVVHLMGETLAGLIRDETAELLADPALWESLDDDEEAASDLPDGIILLEPARERVSEVMAASALNPKMGQLAIVVNFVKLPYHEQHVFFAHMTGRPTVYDAEAPAVPIVTTMRNLNPGYFKTDVPTLSLGMKTDGRAA